MPSGESSSTPGEEVRQLRGRMVSTEPKASDYFLCTECNKRFASAASLEAHKRVHTMKQPEATLKRRAVAPANIGQPETKKARVHVQRYSDTEEDTGVSTRSGGAGRLLKCKWCNETFSDRSEWADHMRQHNQKTPSSQDLADEDVTTADPHGSFISAVPDTPASVERQFAMRSPSDGSPSSQNIRNRTRNTTLRFEEELGDGQVQCRQCHQVYNNRRGLAAHVAQKHREELDQEQRAIEEEKMRKEEIFERRRRDASRLLHSGIPQLITPPSRPISILTRRSAGGIPQQRSVSILRRPSAGPAAGGAQGLIYPRRTTLEILTQPTPVVPSSGASGHQGTTSTDTPSRTEPAKSTQAVSKKYEDPPTGAYAEALKTIISPIPKEQKGTGGEGQREDVIDESAYEFSTEVTVTAEPHPAQESGGQSDRAGGASVDEHAGETEIESYPCRYCKDRVFLTSYGLERHTKMSHPGKLEEVLGDIRKIQQDKAKRTDGANFGAGNAEDGYYDESGRVYERFPHMDSRHQIPGLGVAAQSASYLRKRHGGYDKENEPSDDTSEIMQMERAALVAATLGEGRFGSRSRRQADVARAKYQSCDICGILINTEHPKALESHRRAHQKNQELRDELLRSFGPAWVERVTCRECNLVFKDEDKLEQHRRNVHVRRRHFLCRFCGDVFRNMRDLNAHKERRHETFEGHRRFGDSSPPAPRRQVSTTRRAGHEGYTAEMAGTVEEFACRSTCEICGLQMVRPSNLIRHMKTQHNRTNFTATVETRGMPPFKIDVNEGRFMWGCCDEVFDDRQAFINHRRFVHGPTYVSNPKECEHCGLTFKNNAAYINHLRSHRPRVCNICGESFGNSVVDLNAFRAHMIRHRDQGYTVRLPPIEEELAIKEQQELWKAINDEEVDDGSEDDYSIYSGSGVESDVEDDSGTDDDDAPPDQMTCPICEKTFSCIYRYCDHWKLHCLQPYRNEITLKTAPFSYKTRRTGLMFKCGHCPKKFKRGTTLVLHQQHCGSKKRGIVPEEESSSLAPSGASSKVSSPMKNTRSKTRLDETTKSPEKKTVEDEPMAALAESLKELEDQLDVSPKKKRFVPDYIEKAYIVEWDTNKTPNENPYVCQNCKQSFGDFLSLIMHVKTHIAHPITEDYKEETTEEGEVEKETENGDEMETEEMAKKKNDENVTVSILRIRTSTAEALGKYACQVCGRCFHDEKELNSHLDDTHRPRKRNRCNLCRRRFWTSAGLKRHQHRRHDFSAMHHSCGTCGKRFINMESLNAHEAKHELSNSLYQCEDCSVSFYGLDQLKGHFKQNHHGVTLLSCPICAKIHTDQKSLEDHFNSDHPTVHTYCRICKKRFHTPMEARRHRRRVHMDEGKTFETCTLCGKKYYDRRQLAIHTWRHLTTKSHQCRICDLAFENDEEVRTHLEKKHEIGWLDSQDMIVRNSTVFGAQENTDGVNEDRAFSCHVCGKKFESKSAVKEHLEKGTHKRKKSKKCTVCGISFWKPWALAQHMNRRHNQRMNEDQEMGNGEEKVNLGEGQVLSADVAQLLLNHGNIQYVSGDNVQMIVADEATAAAIGRGEEGGEYQVLLVQNENGETIQLALGPQAQLELAQLQHQPTSSTAGNTMGPMEIDETNYQQFLNN